MQVKAAIFDLDGTLLDSLLLIRLSFEKVFRDLGIPWGKGEVLKTIGLPLREVAKEYAPGRSEEFLTVYADFQKQHQEELLRAYPGACETLETLKDQGYLLALATSKRRQATTAGLSLTGLDKFLDVIVTVDDVAKPKPHPDSVLRTLELLKTGPAAAVYIGDTGYDILTGKSAGVTTIGVTWGMSTREELDSHLPDFIVDNWKSLLDLLPRKNK